MKGKHNLHELAKLLVNLREQKDKAKGIEPREKKYEVAHRVGEKEQPSRADRLEKISRQAHALRKKEKLKQKEKRPYYGIEIVEDDRPKGGLLTKGNQIFQHSDFEEDEETERKTTKKEQESDED